MDKIEYRIIRVLFALVGTVCFMSAEHTPTVIWKFIWYFAAIAVISIISASISEQHFTQKK